MQLQPYIRRPHFYETDGMNIIHHSNYIRWFEEARVMLLEQMGFGYEKCMAAGVHIAVLGVSCDYKSMVRFGDTVQVYLAVTAFSQTRMTVSYHIVDANTHETRAVGETRHCFYSTAGRPVSLKKTVPALYDLFSAIVTDEVPVP